MRSLIPNNASGGLLSRHDNDTCKCGLRDGHKIYPKKTCPEVCFLKEDKKMHPNMSIEVFRLNLNPKDNNTRYELWTQMNESEPFKLTKIFIIIVCDRGESLSKVISSQLL